MFDLSKCTDRTRKILTLAAELAATKPKAQYIDSVHLVQAILDEESNIAAQVLLEDCEVSAERFRNLVSETIGPDWFTKPNDG